MEGSWCRGQNAERQSAFLSRWLPRRLVLARDRVARLAGDRGDAGVGGEVVGGGESLMSPISVRILAPVLAGLTGRGRL